MSEVISTEVLLCKYLDTPRYRGTFFRSLSCLLQQSALMVGWWVATAKYAPTFSLGGSVAAAFVWAALVMRSYMIFHDCGHGSFFQGFSGAKFLNWATLHITATMCSTPTDWNVGHQLHHANVGNTGQDEYDWGETIFLTSEQFLKLPKWKQTLWRVSARPSKAPQQSSSLRVLVYPCSSVRLTFCTDALRRPCAPRR